MERKVDGISVHGMSPGPEGSIYARCAWRTGRTQLEWSVGSVSRTTRRLRQVVKEHGCQAKEFRFYTG